MNILFRLDCSVKIGMGHLVRCMALASELKEHGARVVFVIRELVCNGNELLRSEGFELYQLVNTSYLDQVIWEKDAEQTIQVIQELNIHFEWLIVDDYGIDARWETKLQSFVNKIMIVDDLANRPHACDVLLDQNSYDNQHIRYLHLIPKKAVQLLGPEYALLRRDFRYYKKLMRQRNKSGKRILIFFGGGDYADEIIKALQACLKLPHRNIAIDVVVGMACSKREIIEKICHDAPRARYFCQVANIAELMADVDLAIGAGGVTTWERCCLGVPSIVLSVAVNQVAVTQTASSLGVLRYLGKAEEVSEDQLIAAVTALIDDSPTLNNMSIKAKQLVNGMGCEKVAKYLLGLA